MIHYFQVQCSNIHFHAHSDGSTTLHRHKTCRRHSQESIYGFDDEDNNNNINIDDEFGNVENEKESTETLKKIKQGKEGAISKVKYY